MSDQAPTKLNMQIEGERFRSGVSESLIQGLGGNVNFQNYFQTIEKDYKLNGAYGFQALPLTVDGLDVIEFNSQIIDVWLYNLTPGSSSFVEFDCEVITTPGGAGTSIFTTKPQIAFNAVADCWVGVVNPSLVGPLYVPPTYTPPAHTVRPVLDLSVVNSIPAWSALKVSMTSAQQGARDCGLLVRYRRIN